jgi:hypothetical protein
MTNYERERYWSEQFNALQRETRDIVLAVMRAERARDLRRIRDELTRHHNAQLSHIDDLIGRIERDLEVTHPLPDGGAAGNGD